MDKSIWDSLLPYLAVHYANPSSIHREGRLARDALERARATIAAFFGTEAQDIIFTSGQVESANLAIQGFAFANSSKGRHIITSSKEPLAILGPCKFLELCGFKASYVGSYDALEKQMRTDTILAAMSDAAWPVEEFVRAAKRRGAAFFLDASNRFGKTAIDVHKLGVDMLSCDSASIGGPQGVGALYIKKGIKLAPIVVGGHHERSFRAGTENVAGIVGFAKAVEVAARCL